MILIKVIFLDIDGVLNTLETFKKRKEIYIKTGILKPKIDIFRVEYLKEIITNTNAQIVLTSSYRKQFININNKLIPVLNDAKELNNLFSLYNLKIYDITSINKYDKRQNEIKEWLTINYVESFIIIDDESYDLDNYKDFLIKTRNSDKVQIGLCKNHIELAINMLNNKKLVLKPNY